MLGVLATLAAFAALGLALWLRERVLRLEDDVRALRAREEERRRFSEKVNMAAEQPAAAARAMDAAAPPVAFPVPPVAFAPPPSSDSKKIPDAAAAR